MLFNTDYYFVYTSHAKRFIDEGFGSAFNAIDFVQQYEKDNFGETNTDISDPCKVANMAVYIIGEEILSEVKELRYFWDSRLTEQATNDIIDELILSILK